MDSIGKRLLSALRGRGDERGIAGEELPPAPSAAQLRQALLTARSGRSDDCEHLSLLLLAADRERSDAATTYSMPTGATADRLAGLLVRHAPTLGRSRERLLRFHLGLTSRAVP